MGELSLKQDVIEAVYAETWQMVRGVHSWVDVSDVTEAVIGGLEKRGLEGYHPQIVRGVVGNHLARLAGYGDIERKVWATKSWYRGKP